MIVEANDRRQRNRIACARSGSSASSTGHGPCPFAARVSRTARQRPSIASSSGRTAPRIGGRPPKLPSHPGRTAHPCPGDAAAFIAPAALLGGVSTRPERLDPAAWTLVGVPGVMLTVVLLARLPRTQAANAPPRLPPLTSSPSGRTQRWRSPRTASTVIGPGRSCAR